MITEDERFIAIQGILAFSDVHPADCSKINELIIELSKENQKLTHIIEELEKWLEEEKPTEDMNENFILIRLSDLKDKLKQLKEEVK